MNGTELIIGNLCTLLAMGSNAFSATRKSASGILLTQNLSQAIYCASAITLKGYSAAVQNIVSIVRNFTAARKIQSKFLEWMLVVLGVVLGIVFNNRGIVGLLPVIGNLQYTLAIFRFSDNQRVLKISFLLSVVSFAIFNAVICNFVGVAADSFVVVTTAAVLIRERKNK